MFSRVSALDEPYQDRLSEKVTRYFFRDALVIARDKKELTPSQIQYAIFSHMPPWVNALMKIRNRIVSVFGFDVGLDNMKPPSDELSVGEQAGFLTISEKYHNEIISRSEDKYMEFYLSVALLENEIVVSTLVNQKTLIGRIYVTVIIPFHYVIARTVINNAVKAKRV